MIEIHPGDVIFFKGKSFISRGIRWFTKSEWNHVALAVDGTYIIEATAAGVERNKIELALKKCEKFMIRRIDSLTVAESELLKTKAYSLFYDNYDFLQLISMAPYFLFRRIGWNLPFLIFNSRGKMICSELVAVCYAAAGYKFSKRLKTETPDSLSKNSLFTTMFNGRYEEFIKK